MIRWTLPLALTVSLLTFSALASAQVATAQVSAAEDRASQFVIGDAKQSETFGSKAAATLLIGGALAIAASLAVLLLSSRHYNQTNSASIQINKHIPNEETES